MPVNRQLHRNYKANVQKNKDAVTPIVDTIKLSGGQNLPFRSHCVSVKEQPKVAMSGSNNRVRVRPIGNIIKILQPEFQVHIPINTKRIY